MSDRLTPGHDDPMKHVTAHAIDIAEQRDRYAADLRAERARSQGLEEALRKIERVYERTMPGPRDALRDRVLEIIASLSLGLPDEEGQNDLGYEQPPAAGACGPSPDVEELPADDGCFCDDYGMCWNCAPRAVRAVVTVARRISEKGAVAGELGNLRETFRVLDSDGPVPATCEAKPAGTEGEAHKQESPSVRDVTGEGER